MSGRIALLRHGQSAANAAGLFTGISDSPLTDIGREEAVHAAGLLTAAAFVPTVIVTSPLARALDTARIIIRANKWEATLQVDPRLRERDYGALTGRTKNDVRASAGDAQFTIWRRSFDMPPPPAPDPVFDALWAQPALKDVALTARTRAESLADVVTRVAPVLEDIQRHASTGSVLIVAHGNSLRAFSMLLDDLTVDEVAGLNLPTGHPLLYDLETNRCPVTRGGIYLDPAAAIHAATVIAHEGGT